MYFPIKVMFYIKLYVLYFKKTGLLEAQFNTTIFSIGKMYFKLKNVILGCSLHSALL